MKKVEFLKLQNDGSQTVVATCYKDGDVARCEGSETLVHNLINDGIRVAADPSRKLYPTDGDSFLDELPKVFDSPYLLAALVEE